MVFLFFLGLMLVSGPTRWWLLAATLFGLVLSWGRNLMWFNELMFNYLPVYNKFRAPTISLIIVEFTMPLLGILGLQKLIEDAKEPANRSGLQRKVLIAGGIAGGLALFTFYIVSHVCLGGFSNFEASYNFSKSKASVSSLLCCSLIKCTSIY